MGLLKVRAGDPSGGRPLLQAAAGDASSPSPTGKGDALSLRAGNLLVGNAEGAAALEMTLAGVIVGSVITLAFALQLSMLLELPRLPIVFLVGSMVLIWTAGLLAALMPALRGAGVPPAVATRIFDTNEILTLQSCRAGSPVATTSPHTPTLRCRT